MSVNTPLKAHRNSDVLLVVEIDEDVTGWSFRFDLLTAFDAGSPTATKTSGSGISVSSASSQVSYVHVALAAADLNVAPANYVYTLCRTDAGGKDVLAYGCFTILPPRVP